MGGVSAILSHSFKKSGQGQGRDSETHPCKERRRKRKERKEDEEKKKVNGKKKKKKNERKKGRDKKKKEKKEERKERIRKKRKKGIDKKMKERGKEKNEGQPGTKADVKKAYGVNVVRSHSNKEKASVVEMHCEEALLSILGEGLPHDRIMGSHMKKSIFHEQAAKVLKKWHQEVKKKHGKGSSHSSPRTPSTSTRSSPNASPVHQLYRYKSVGHTTPSPRRSFSDQEYSDTEFEMSPLSTTSLIPSTKPNSQEAVPARQRIHPEEQRHEEDFSFVKVSDQTRKNP
ncbi:hypothetical protein COCNU_scaffold026665G000010 [Cocos nucifera]|nr:hypothetical protein [Cocos nucifera]